MARLLKSLVEDLTEKAFRDAIKRGADGSVVGSFIKDVQDDLSMTDAELSKLSAEDQAEDPRANRKAWERSLSVASSDELFRALKAHRPLFLMGAAGSGKTASVREVAKKLPWVSISGKDYIDSFGYEAPPESGEKQHSGLSSLDKRRAILSEEQRSDMRPVEMITWELSMVLPEDVGGFPYINKHNRMDSEKSEAFPTVEGNDPRNPGRNLSEIAATKMLHAMPSEIWSLMFKEEELPSGEKKIRLRQPYECLLFLDELNQAAPSVQNTVYGLTDPTNPHWGDINLPPFYLVAAGNYKSENESINSMSAPLMGRIPPMQWRADNKVLAEVWSKQPRGVMRKEKLYYKVTPEQAQEMVVKNKCSARSVNLCLDAMADIWIDAFNPNDDTSIREELKSCTKFLYTILRAEKMANELDFDNEIALIDITTQIRNCLDVLFEIRAGIYDKIISEHAVLGARWKVPASEDGKDKDFWLAMTNVAANYKSVNPKSLQEYMNGYTEISHAARKVFRDAWYAAYQNGKLDENKLLNLSDDEKKEIEDGMNKALQFDTMTSEAKNQVLIEMAERVRIAANKFDGVVGEGEGEY
jgi:Cdc6-like AAA superfamily ATPase